MKFSIVTIVLNAADDLPLTIESVLQQSFRDYEYIVVDGGSWDQTSDVLNTYRDDISRVVRVEDAGIFSAMNDALEFCSGDYVLFLNAKDRLYSADVLEKIAANMDAHSDVVFGDHIYVNGPSHHLHKASRFDFTYQALEDGQVTHKWHSRIPCHQATFTRTSLLRELRYDTRIEICADHDFMFRAYSDGAKFQYIDEIVCHYMAGGFSALRTDRLRQELSSTYRKFSRRPSEVDRLFYGDAPSPFAINTPKTGRPYSGIGPAEGPYIEFGIPSRISWCDEQGFEFISPSDRAATECTAEIYNTFPNQQITVSVEGNPIGYLAVPVGFSALRADFMNSVPPNSRVRFSASQCGALSPNDERLVSVAVGGVTFEGLSSSEDLPSRDAVLGSGLYLVNERTFSSKILQLSSGWSTISKDHVWSIGPASIIKLVVDKNVSEICLHLAGHPVVANAQRGVAIRVNGSHEERVALEVAPRPVRLTVPMTATPDESRTVIVTLEPLETGQAPDDPRDLGVCLFGMQLI